MGVEESDNEKDTKRTQRSDTCKQAGPGRMRGENLPNRIESPDATFIRGHSERGVLFDVDRTVNGFEVHFRTTLSNRSLE